MFSVFHIKDAEGNKHLDLNWMCNRQQDRGVRMLTLAELQQTHHIYGANSRKFGGGTFPGLLPVSLCFPGRKCQNVTTVLLKRFPEAVKLPLCTNRCVEFDETYKHYIRSGHLRGAKTLLERWFSLSIMNTNDFHSSGKSFFPHQQSRLSRFLRPRQIFISSARNVNSDSAVC